MYWTVDLGFHRHLFIVCAAAAAAAARFGLLGNFLFLFRREFMNSTWSIGAVGRSSGAASAPLLLLLRPSRPNFRSLFANLESVCNVCTCACWAFGGNREGKGGKKERRKERKKGRFASLGSRACVISALCTINNRHRRHTSWWLTFIVPRSTTKVNYVSYMKRRSLARFKVSCSLV